MCSFEGGPHLPEAPEIQAAGAWAPKAGWDRAEPRPGPGPGPSMEPGVGRTMPGMWTWAQVAGAHPVVKETRYPNVCSQTCYTDT